MRWLWWSIAAIAYVLLVFVASALQNRWSERRGRRPDHNDYGES